MYNIYRLPWIIDNNYNLVYNKRKSVDYILYIRVLCKTKIHFKSNKTTGIEYNCIRITGQIYRKINRVKNPSNQIQFSTSLN